MGHFATGVASPRNRTYLSYRINSLSPTHPAASGLNGLDQCFQQ